MLNYIFHFYNLSRVWLHFSFKFSHFCLFKVLVNYKFDS